MAQTNAPKIRCSTVEYYNKLFQADPSFQQKLEANRKKISIKNTDPRALRILALSDTITLVIHVIGNTAIQALVTNAVIQSMFVVLNEV